MASNSASDGTLFELVPIEGKGMGLRATEPIAKGTRIMSDKALILFELDEGKTSLAKYNAAIGPKITKLKGAAYNTYMSLANIYPDDGKLESQQAGIARTSSILLQANPDKHAVFPNAARLNHSCSPNAFYSWNEAIGRLTVHAVRDIAKGEEITIHYHIAVEISADRQRRHDVAFRFVCKCSVCRAPLPVLRQRDNLLCVLRKHLDVFDTGKIDELKHENSEFALRHCREMVEIAKVTGMANTIISDGYTEAALICVFNSDQARAIAFAKKAYETRLILEGPDSVKVKTLAKLAKNPANQADFGIKDDWKSKPQDIPTDKSEEAFDAWLWRIPPDTILLDRSMLRPILADFTDIDLFPLFEKLPIVNQIDPKFWHFNPKEQNIAAVRFWCLLGEIMFVDLTDSLKLIVKDKAGTNFYVSFQTPKRGLELSIPLVRKGNAIAIIGAERRLMIHGSHRGIVQRRPDQTKIFDLSLDRLLELSKKVQEYAIEDDERKTKCLGCDKVSEDLKAHCSKCNMMYFCDRECQIRAWKEKGHKEDCPLLRTKEIAGLLCCAWESFE